MPPCSASRWCLSQLWASFNEARRSAGYTALRMAFDETWLVAVTRKRLAGEAPKLVPGASLAAVGGKLLLHHGGAEEKGAARQAHPQARPGGSVGQCRWAAALASANRLRGGCEEAGFGLLWLWRHPVSAPSTCCEGARVMHGRVSC